MKKILLVLIILLLNISILAKNNVIKIKKINPQKQLDIINKQKKLPSFIKKRFKPKRITFPAKKEDITGNYHLLILLVDFPEDDNPKTTGNGKYDLSIPDSLFTISSPPHNAYYFEKTMIALRYYYKAASFENINIISHIFPKQTALSAYDSTLITYTLPNEMAYYNPDMNNYDLTISRFEQLFTDIFETADKDTSLHFADYDGYLVIHAGSDWQHDIYGDTPNDIPSFNMTVSEDVAVAVDNGDVIIDHTSIIPETISQDGQLGSINAVMVHEMGHQFGFVDLYNTAAGFPAVGYFDIMDSGGFTFAADTLGNIIEGALPVLPCVWSRMIPWENTMREQNRLKDICELNPSSEDTFYIEILAAEKPDNIYNPDDNKLQFIKIPINNNEYFLLENRAIDLDNDTCFIKADSTKRIPLYPVDPYNNFNYEYDYLLPGLGGLCIWHIDDDVIYNPDYCEYSDTLNNFQYNTVNTRHKRRGVYLIEADDIDDIGNIYSWSDWRGTLYEYFSETAPVFVWSEQDSSYVIDRFEFHNNHFGPDTHPNSYSNDGINSLIDIFDISDFGPTMSFKFRYQFFGEIEEFKPDKKFNPDRHLLLANFNDTQYIVITADSSIIIKRGEWQQHLYLSLTNKINQSISAYDFDDDNNDEFLIATLDSLYLYDYNVDSLFSYSLSDTLTDSPIFLESPYILVPTSDSLLLLHFEKQEFSKIKSLPVSNPKISYNPILREIVVLSYPNKFMLIDELGFTPHYEQNISTELGNFYPITVLLEDNSQLIYFQDKYGSIYQYATNKLGKIFDGQNYDWQKISNIGIGDINLDGWQDIVFTADDKIYAIQKNGAFISHYPKEFDYAKYSENSSQIIGDIYNDMNLFYAGEANYSQCFDKNGDIVPQFTFAIGSCLSSIMIDTLGAENHLYIPVSDSLIKILSYEKDISTLFWNGYKNGSTRWAVVTTPTFGSPEVSKFEVYAYPNPAYQGDVVKIRIIPTKDGQASLKIFDIAGNILFKKENKEIFTYKNNAFVWNIDKISTGIYFGLLDINGEKKVTKIAVIK